MGEQFEFLAAERLPELLEGEQLDLPDPFLRQAEVFADLLEGLSLLFYGRACQAEMI